MPLKTKRKKIKTKRKVISKFKDVTVSIRINPIYMKSSLCVLSQKFLKDSSLLISYTFKKKKELVNGILSHFLAF